MIVEAGGRLSFADAAFAVGLAGLAVSPRQVQHLTELVGAELAAARDERAAARRRRQLRPRVAETPGVVAVEVDGGRLRTRAAGCGPGVHQPESKEDKVACLVSLRSDAHAHDPQPEPPPSFVEPRRVQRLVRQMKGLPGEPPGGAAAAAGPAAPAAAAPAARAEPPAYPAAPRRLVRTCVASLQDSRAFGPLVAAEAQERDFYRAGRRAFVADGQAYNWSIQQGYFPDFEPIVDLLHVLCYLYRAAWAAGGDEAARWSRYAGWLRGCWQGRAAGVLAELRQWQGRLGEPPAGAEEGDPRRLLAEAVTYLGNNAPRMDYPRYRRQGLPVTSSLVESLVGEFNARVKGPGKFWNRPAGAEAILQVRAALLSEDDRLDRHFAQRPGSPYRRHRKAG